MRLLMVTGVGPGVGKTTLASELTLDYRDADILVEDDYLFEREEFGEVAAAFRSGAHPSPQALEDAYAWWVSSLDASRRVGVLDWSFVDLAEDLGWAKESFDALLAHLTRCRTLTSHLDPRLFYLDADPSIGLDRAEAARGSPWLQRQADNLGLSEDDWPRRRYALIDAYATRRLRVLRALRESGWEAKVLDGTRPLRDVVSGARAMMRET